MNCASYTSLLRFKALIENQLLMPLPPQQILILTWLATHVKAIHNCEESQVHVKDSCY